MRGGTEHLPGRPRDGQPSRVVVTGLGVVSPVGAGTEEFWSALLAGRAGTGEITLFDTADCLTHRGGEVRDWARPAYERRYGPLSRSESFALAATGMALRDGGLRPADDHADGEGDAADGAPRTGPYAPERFGVAFGIVVGNRPHLEAELRAAHGRGRLPSPGTAHDPARIAALPARRFGLHGPNLVLPTACAAGNTAIAQAADAIASGRADAMVAGGADELSEAMFLMFNSFRALAPEAVQPFDAHRRGLMLGEGAGALLLESEERARARGARVYAVVAGHGSYSDAHHMTAPHPDGLGAARSMRAALAMAGLTPGQVSFVSAHGTGTPANDAAEAAALTEVFGPAAVPVTALKSALGHAQGAAGAIAAVACALAVRDRLVPPTANTLTPDPAFALDLVVKEPRSVPVRAVLNNAFGFGGNNCCVVFTAPDAEEGRA
ncbi:beta-ketoacyl-ACP synthase II [Streptomyces capparidis]